MLSKISVITFLVTSILGASFFTGSSLLENEILIESEESKTKDMTSVFNKIKWITLPDKDIWMMNQSHYGVEAHDSKWERLAIVIDKTKRPMTAKYYQIENGPLLWSDDLASKRVSYRASCYTCHSNGPRAIRPINDLSFKNKAQVFLMNLRIKFYGRIHYDKTHDQEDFTMDPPFRHHDERNNDELRVHTCLQCHQEEGLFARGTLKRQQLGTIQHMVDAGHMPPAGFKLSAKEKKELKNFMRGFL